MAYVSLHIDSEFLGANTNITVILPEKKGEQTPEAFYGSGKKYKVLWLFHGGHGDCTDWIRKTKIELYACEKDLVVVCPSAQSSFYQNWPTFGPGYYMKDFFFHELMPLIYGWFPVSDRKEDNYIAGLSMGGMQTQRCVFAHPELFRWAGIFSGGLTIRDEEADYSAILLDPEEFSRRFAMLFVACGTQEWSYESTKENEEAVLAAGVPIVTFEGYGYHDWTFWRHCAKDFLPRLFR